MSKQDLDNWLNDDDDDDDDEEEEVKKNASEKHSAEKKWQTGGAFICRVPTSEDFFAEFGV